MILHDGECYDIVIIVFLYIGLICVVFPDSCLQNNLITVQLRNHWNNHRYLWNDWNFLFDLHNNSRMILIKDALYKLLYFTRNFRYNFLGRSIRECSRIFRDNYIYTDIKVKQTLLILDLDIDRHLYS